MLTLARPARVALWVGAAVLITIVIGFGFLQFLERLQWAIFPWTRYAYHSESMRPMEIRLGRKPSIILKIPRAHIVWLPDDDEDGTKESIGLDPPLPLLNEMPSRGSSAEQPTEHFFFMLAKQPPQDLIDFRDGLMSPGARYEFSRRSGAFDVYVKYQMPGIPPEERAENGVQESLFLPAADKAVSIICEEGKRPPPRCNLRFAVTENISANASIPRDDLDRYDEVAERIRAYVRSVEGRA